MTWNRVLHVDDDTGATDLVIDPLNNKTLYAATYQRRRAQWGMNGGGAGSGIWKSTDGGQTWAKLETGLPAGPKGRIGLAIYRRNPNVLYATVEHPAESGVYRTDNAGAELAEAERHQPAADVLQPDSRSIRRPTRASTCSASRCTSPTMAGGRSAVTAPSAFTSITTRCGSIRAIRAT